MGRELSEWAESNMRSNFQAGRVVEAEVAKLGQGLYPERTVSLAGFIPKSLIQERGFFTQPPPSHHRGYGKGVANDQT